MSVWDDPMAREDPDEPGEAAASSGPGSPPRYVSVIGQSVCDAAMTAMGEELGELLAERGFVVVCGGMGGVMSAVASGVKRRGGVCIGILPGLDRGRADAALTYSICTGVGHGRNLAVASSGDVVIALGGAWGTLSEIALARCAGRTVILLDSWRIEPWEGKLEGVLQAGTPAEAADLAVEHAGR